MTTRSVSVLGSTGSIGCNTLDVIRHFSEHDEFEIVALTGGNNVKLLARQAVEFGAAIAVTVHEHKYGELKSALAGTGIETAAGATALLEAAGRPADWVMAGIVGIAGLAPTLEAARNGATIALANKECLVSGGKFFLDRCNRTGAKILPVDSEHNAIFQVFEERNREAIERVVLTASGGPFRDWPLEKMALADTQAAANHPNWSMGLKISIDSATMFNKALEMIEARHMFAIAPNQIEVIVHPQSVVHSMVGYADGSVLAQLGCPDMRTAIGYALSWPQRRHVPVERLDLAAIARLDFAAPDETRFPALRLAREAMAADGLMPAVMNSAKEAALDAFIERKIGFLDIARLVEKAMKRISGHNPPTSLEDIVEADKEARQFVGGALETI
jgi:1-deoxy-D-xylulose-5-phosphate reductoisomerase